MRYLAIILSIYSLLLTVVPCSDAHSTVQKSDVSEMVQSTDNVNDVHLDLCSPFCACACCQTLAEVYAYNFNFTTQALNTKQATLILNLLETDLPDWYQPPIV